jgi:hypothetical protein
MPLNKPDTPPYKRDFPIVQRQAGCRIKKPTTNPTMVKRTTNTSHLGRRQNINPIFFLLGKYYPLPTKNSVLIILADFNPAVNIDTPQ